MNPLLERYMADTEFPEVSGAEQLEMLQLRDRLLELAAELSAEEKEFLAHADRRLIQQAPQVHLELSQFINLATQRQTKEISAERWWWYLDVLAHSMPLLDNAA
jgi:hypothetical protein